MTKVAESDGEMRYSSAGRRATAAKRQRCRISYKHGERIHAGARPMLSFAAGILHPRISALGVD